MPRHRTKIEEAAGKLASAIQREWGDEVGQPCADASEEVMHTSHDLLKAAKGGSVASATGGRSVTDFLGEKWVKEHPRVNPFIAALEAAERAESDA